MADLPTEEKKVCTFFKKSGKRKQQRRRVADSSDKGYISLHTNPVKYEFKFQFCTDLDDIHRSIH